ncbi:hypothetical protein ACZ91_28595 [Streptomyces regensis]|nr:hypothetical protein ACZ91_28595 [Streptomyces regensis]
MGLGEQVERRGTGSGQLTRVRARTRRGARGDVVELAGQPGDDTVDREGIETERSARSTGDGQAALAARAVPLPCAREASRCAADGVRASSSASSTAQCPPATPRRAACADAAANTAASSPALRNLPTRNDGRSSTLPTTPRSTASSRPPECT